MPGLMLDFFADSQILAIEKIVHNKKKLYSLPEFKQKNLSPPICCKILAIWIFFPRQALD